MDDQIVKAKEQALSRKDILDKVEKCKFAFEEDKWLDEYEKVIKFEEELHVVFSLVHLFISNDFRSIAVILLLYIPFSYALFGCFKVTVTRYLRWRACKGFYSHGPQYHSFFCFWLLSHFQDPIAYLATD